MPLMCTRYLRNTNYSISNSRIIMDLQHTSSKAFAVDTPVLLCEIYISYWSQQSPIGRPCMYVMLSSDVSWNKADPNLENLFILEKKFLLILAQIRYNKPNRSFGNALKGTQSFKILPSYINIWKKPSCWEMHCSFVLHSLFNNVKQHRHRSLLLSV